MGHHGKFVEKKKLVRFGPYYINFRTIEKKIFLIENEYISKDESSNGFTVPCDAATSMLSCTITITSFRMKFVKYSSKMSGIAIICMGRHNKNVENKKLIRLSVYLIRF